MNLNARALHKDFPVGPLSLVSWHLFPNANARGRAKSGARQTLTQDLLAVIGWLRVTRSDWLVP